MKKILIYLVSCFELSLSTVSYGNEISWTLGTCSSNQVYGNGQTISHTCCLSGGKHSLTCSDSFGDGWNGGYITIENKEYCKDFLALNSMTVDVWIGVEYSKQGNLCSIPYFQL